MPVLRRTPNTIQGRAESRRQCKVADLSRRALERGPCQNVTMTESWTIRHFTQVNPMGPGQDNVSALLRRIADTIDTFEGIEVQDLVMDSEITEDGPGRSLTIYFHLPGDRGVDPEDEPQS